MPQGEGVAAAGTQRLCCDGRKYDGLRYRDGIWVLWEENSMMVLVDGRSAKVWAADGERESLCVSRVDYPVQSSPVQPRSRPGDYVVKKGR